MASEPSPQVRQECIKALTKLEKKEGLSTVVRALNDRTALVRLAAVWGLYRLAGTECAPALTNMDRLRGEVDALILDLTCRLLFRDTLASLFSTFCLCTVELSADEIDGSYRDGVFSMSNNLTALRILVLHDAFNA